MTLEDHGTLAETGKRNTQRFARRFAARIGKLKDLAAVKLIDELAAWVEDTYRRDLEARPSMHVYVRSLPDEIVAKINRLSDSEAVHSAIMEQFPAGSVITPMKQTDELYISHYNKD